MDDSEEFYDDLDFDYENTTLKKIEEKYNKNPNLYKLEEEDEEDGYADLPNEETASENRELEDLDRNQPIDLLQKQSVNRIASGGKQSVGIGEGNVFESSEESDPEEVKDVVFDIKPMRDDPPLSDVVDSNSYDTIEKMLEANKKLSTDLMYLIQAIETQLVKFKDERERNMQKMKTRDDKPPELKKKDKELMGFQKKANKLSREIDLMKRRLEGAHSDESSIKMENELNDKLALVSELETQIKGIKKVGKEQSKALTGLNNEGVSDEYISRVKEQLAEEFKRDDKKLKIQHQNIIETEEKCRRLVRLIKELKGARKETKPIEDQATDVGGDDELIRLNEEIEELEKSELAELEHRKLMFNQNKQELSHDVNMMSLQIREKEQEEKLNDLKAKELRRQVPNNQLKPLRRNQSQSERNQNRNNSMIKGSGSANNSMMKLRNASATRIPTVGTNKKK